jgi:LysM repeat protein
MARHDGSLQQPAGLLGRLRDRASVELVLFCVCAGALVGLSSGWAILQVILWRYEDRIYPNVQVLDVNVGGLTCSKASERLTEVFSQMNAGRLILSDGQQEWSMTWQRAGLRLDADTTAQNAFKVGRASQGLRTFLQMQRDSHHLGPVLILDAAGVRRVLEELAPELSVIPANASLRLERDRFVPVPSQPGRVLDVEAALSQTMEAFDRLGSDSRVTLPFEAVAPQIADATRAQAHAEEMLNHRITLSAYDVTTNRTFSWTLERGKIAEWLRVEPTQDGGDLRVLVAEEAVETTITVLAKELGEGRGLRLEEATAQVIHILEAGGGTVQLYLTHAPRTHTVQDGDTLSIIARLYGMVPGLIVEANPEAEDLSHLYIGQKLMIPSQDLLTPYLPAPDKRITISIADQRMRAYERGIPIYDWSVSTGTEDSPTYTGAFQILNKEEQAYARQWDMWMPHFLAIYRVGGETYNGIHGLPILSSGLRLWEGALGSPASYGCIILGVQEAEALYHWADLGTAVTIE